MSPPARPLPRRRMLKAAGVTLALPFLTSARTAPAVDEERRAAPESDGTPRRMVFICNNLGLHMPHFVPEQTGFGYAPSPYLEVMGDLRRDMTVFSGTSHPDVDGGHAAEKSFLTAAPHPGSGSFRNTISVDQLAAEAVGGRTRIRSLVLTANGGGSLSWTRSGVPIPGEQSPSRVFRELFTAGTPDEVERQVTRLRQGASVMDLVLGEAAVLRKTLTRDDRDKFDEYAAGVREVERNMVRQQEWERKPKPNVDAESPVDIRDQADTIGRSKLMYDLLALALRTDSTRIATVFSVGFFAVPPIRGVTEGYHTLSHHGKNPEKLAQLALIEVEHLRILRDFLDRLRSVREGGRDAAGPHDGAVRQRHRQRVEPQQFQPAGRARRRRFPARPAPGVRPGAQCPALERVRQHAATARPAGRPVRQQHGHRERVGICVAVVISEGAGGGDRRR